MTYLSNDDSAVYNLNFSYYNPQFVPNVLKNL